MSRSDGDKCGLFPVTLVAHADWDNWRLFPATLVLRGSSYDKVSDDKDSKVRKVRKVSTLSEASFNSMGASADPLASVASNLLCGLTTDFVELADIDVRRLSYTKDDA